MNVSTVLASIGILLANPNPDDGLMADVVTANFSMLLINASCRSLPIPQA